MKKFIIISCMFMISSIIGASILSLYDKMLQIEMSKLDRDIRTQREDLQNLKAQWNYLNSKTNITNLVKKELPQMRNLDLQLDVRLDRLNSLPKKQMLDKSKGIDE